MSPPWHWSLFLSTLYENKVQICTYEGLHVIWLETGFRLYNLIVITKQFQHYQDVKRKDLLSMELVNLVLFSIYKPEAGRYGF